MSAPAGRRIVNTRALHQAAALDALLRAAGAHSLSYPCIQIAPPADPTPLDAALRELAAGRFAWLLLTSANTVTALAERMAQLGLSLPPVQVAAIGAATARAAATALGLRADYVPAHAVAEVLAEGVPLEPGARLLLPESSLASPTLAERLRERGAEVSAVPAYETVCGSGGVDLPALLAAGGVDAVTLTSGSTARFLVQRLGAAAPLPAGVCIACIGPKTAQAAHACGLRVDLVPAEPSLPALVEALARWFSRRLS